MRLNKNVFFGLCRRVAYAALVSAIVWIFTFLPLPEGRFSRIATVQIVRLLDLPIAVVTQIMPCTDFAVDLWFSVRGGGGCPEPIGNLRTYFFNHMRIGVPTYVLIFYFPSIYRSIRGRRRLDGVRSDKSVYRKTGSAELTARRD